MPVANSYYLDYLVGPLNVVSDEEVSDVKSGDDAESISEIIRCFVRPEFELLTAQSQEDCKNSLRYFLSTKNAPFRKILSDQQESPIGLPTDPSQFFIWIWDVLFPGEDYQIENPEQWDVCKDYSKLEIRSS
jgi:hypothetical protein